MLGYSSLRVRVDLLLVLMRRDVENSRSVRDFLVTCRKRNVFLNDVERQSCSLTDTILP